MLFGCQLMAYKGKCTFRLCVTDDAGALCLRRACISSPNFWRYTLSQQHFNGEKAALLLGSGAPASELVLRAKVRFPRAHVVSIAHDEPTAPHDVHFPIWETDGLLAYLREREVTAVLHAGDMGRYREVKFPISRPLSVNRRRLQTQLGKQYPITQALVFLEDLLRQNRILPFHLCHVFPELSLPEGVVPGTERDISETFIQNIVKHAIDDVTRKGKVARNIIAFDDLKLIGARNEDTAAFLHSLKSIRRPDGAIRTVAKLCPPDILPTMSAPFLGNYTFEPIRNGNPIDLFLFDSSAGVVVNMDGMVSEARELGITVAGVRMTRPFASR